MHTWIACPSFNQFNYLFFIGTVGKRVSRVNNSVCEEKRTICNECSIYREMRKKFTKYIKAIGFIYFYIIKQIAFWMEMTIANIYRLNILIAPCYDELSNYMYRLYYNTNRNTGKHYLYQQL